MRFSMFLVGCVCLLLCLAFSNGDAQEVKKLKPTQRWTGKINDPEAKSKAPADGYLTDAKKFATLWAAWRDKEKMPEIDFAKQIILVHTVGGPNIPSSSYLLDGDGNLKANTLATLIGGKGFGYSIEVLNREGIKSYRGKKIQETK